MLATPNENEAIRYGTFINNQPWMSKRAFIRPDCKDMKQQDSSNYTSVET